METIKKKYIIDENQRKIAVQIDIADFEKLEQLFEDYALGKMIEENDLADIAHGLTAAADRPWAMGTKRIQNRFNGLP